MNIDRFKFRAWLPEKKEMVQVLIFERKETSIFAGDKRGVCAHVKYFVEKDFRETWELIEIEHLMQCTGAKDKNEKLIYEGDIVKNQNNIPCVVKWEEETGEWDIWNKEIYQQRINCKELEKPANETITLFYALCEAEIIGNIYENPELLEGEDDE